MRNRNLSIAVLIVGTLLTYLNSFPGAFHFDDFALILEYPQVSGPDFKWFSFVEQYGGRPLTLLTLRWQYQLLGPNPTFFHAWSLGLHLLCVAVLFLLLRRLSNNDWFALVAGLIFALHPLQTQPVNYIWSQSVLLAAAFSLTALWLVLPQDQGRSSSPLRLAAVLVVFQLAIWSRTDAMLLILLLAVFDRRVWKPAGALVGINLIGFLFGLFRLAPREVGPTHLNWGGYWLDGAAAFWKYLGTMVWPVGLHVDHDFRSPGILVGGLALIAMLLLLTGLATVRPEVREPGWGVFIPWFGAALTCVALLPGVLVPNTDVFNESRAYLAVAGFAVVAAWGLEQFRRKTAVAAGLVLAFMLIFGLTQTLARNRIWNDDLRLWQDAVGKSPGKSRVQYNLGFAWVGKGELDLAEQAFTRALDLNPRDDLSYAALGYCAEVRGDLKVAEGWYGRAVELNPQNNYAREGLLRVSDGGVAEPAIPVRTSDPGE